MELKEFMQQKDLVIDKCTVITLYGGTGVGKTFTGMLYDEEIAYFLFSPIAFFLKAQISEKLPNAKIQIYNPKNKKEFDMDIEDLKKKGIKYAVIDGADLFRNNLKKDTNENTPAFSKPFGDVNIAGNQKVNYELEQIVDKLKKACDRILFIAHEVEKESKISPDIVGNTGKYILNHLSLAILRLTREYESPEVYSKIDFQGSESVLTKTTGDVKSINVPHVTKDSKANTMNQVFEAVEESLNKEASIAIAKAKEYEATEELVKEIKSIPELMKYTESPMFTEKWNELYSTLNDEQIEEVEVFIKNNYPQFLGWIKHKSHTQNEKQSITEEKKIKEAKIKKLKESLV